MFVSSTLRIALRSTSSTSILTNSGTSYLISPTRRQPLPYSPTDHAQTANSPPRPRPRPKPPKHNTPTPSQEPEGRNEKGKGENIPSGPVTVTVLNPFSIYDVRSLFAHLSPTFTSTPGGTEIGVLPSFDPLPAVPANPLRAPTPAAALAPPQSALPAAVRPGRKTDMAPLWINAPSYTTVRRSWYSGRRTSSFVSVVVYSAVVRTFPARHWKFYGAPYKKLPSFGSSTSAS